MTQQSGQEMGGESSLHSEEISAVQIQQYLTGMEYPADKQALLDTAESNSAPDDVMEFMNKLPEQTYNAQADVEQEFGKIQ